MKALVLQTTGKLALSSLEQPPLPPNWARLRMLAAALNHRDEWIIQGKYANIQYPSILGSDGCGIVVAINADDQRLLGQRVIVNPSLHWGNDERVQSREFAILGMPLAGTFAEYLDVPLDRLHPAPKHLSDEEAAALPLAGLTAFRALFVQGQFQPHERLLITGIGGGVALFALQFAHAVAGEHIAVTSSVEWKLQRAQQLGAQIGVLYTADQWWEELRRLIGGIDLCIDGTCGDLLNRIIAIANPAGRIVIYGATLGGVPNLDVHRLFWKQLRLIGSTMGSDRDFAAMLHFVEQHNIHPVVDSVYSFDEAERAFERLRRREQFGKIVLRICSR